MKKFYYLVLALLISATVISCGGSKTASSSSANPAGKTPPVNLSSSKDITAFSIQDYVGTIGVNTVGVTMPSSTNLSATSLTPTIIHTGASISPDLGIAQNFLFPVIYTVTAADGTTKDYTVTVTVAPDVQPWTMLMGGTSGSSTTGYSVTSDAEGNTYTTGRTNATMFDGHSSLGATMSAFVIKYDLSGAKQWSILQGTASKTTVSNAIASDLSGNIYITGYTDGLFPNIDTFVAKYNSTGTLQWTSLINTAGPSGVTTTKATAVATDAVGNVYITGQTNAALDGQYFQPLTEATFIAKYDTNGVQQWAKLLKASPSGGLKITGGAGIATDTNNDVYVTGYTTGGLEGVSTVPSGTVAFVVKYDTTGVNQWMNLLSISGASTPFGGSGITVDASNNVYATGSANVGGSYGAFVAKYDLTGTWQWTQLLSQSGTTIATNPSITSDNSGHVYIAGTTNGDIDGQVHTGLEDIFVTKYNSNDGTKLGTKLMGTTNVTVNGNGITNVGGSGKICVVGATDGNLDGGQPFIAGPSSDVFVTTDMNF